MRDDGRNKVSEIKKLYLIQFNFFSLSFRDYELFIVGRVNKIPCHLIVDTGANVNIIRKDLGQTVEEKFIWTPHSSPFLAFCQ